MGRNVAYSLVLPSLSPPFRWPVVRKGEENIIPLRIKNVKERNDRFGQILGDIIEEVQIYVVEDREIVDDVYPQQMMNSLMPRALCY